MPHPLSKVRANATVNVTPSALDRAPQFALPIMHVVARWAHIDGDLATIFSHMLKVDIAVGAAVYQAFHGTEARRVALFAAAQKALPEWQVIALQATWNATKHSREIRHKFAHHAWGYCEELPDALLLMPTSVVVDRNISLRQRVEELPDGRGVIAPADIDKEKVQVWRAPDFAKAQMDASQASFLIALLHMAIGALPLEVGRRQLLNEPDFRRAVEPLLRGKPSELRAQLAPPGSDPPAPGISTLWDETLGRR